MTITPANCFNHICHAVDKQIDRFLLQPEGSLERLKGQAITEALNRLFTAVRTKYPGNQLQEKITFIQLDIEQVFEMNLATIDEMLDAEIQTCEDGSPQKQISLRTALNIARKNIFNPLGGTAGPLWGQSEALEKVEGDLKKFIP